MKYHEMRSHLKANGFTFDRQAKGGHEIWRSAHGTILVSRSGLIDRRAKANWMASLNKIVGEKIDTIAT